MMMPDLRSAYCRVAVTFWRRRLKETTVLTKLLLRRIRNLEARLRDEYATGHSHGLAQGTQTTERECRQSYERGFRAGYDSALADLAAGQGPAASIVQAA
jgi:hypothetical protein